MVDKPSTERQALKRRMEQRAKSVPPSFAAEVTKFNTFVLQWQKTLEPEQFRKLLKEMEQTITSLLGPEAAKEEVCPQ
jgi:hypothetical protein